MPPQNEKNCSSGRNDRSWDGTPFLKRAENGWDPKWVKTCFRIQSSVPCFHLVATSPHQSARARTKDWLASSSSTDCCPCGDEVVSKCFLHESRLLRRVEKGMTCGWVGGWFRWGSVASHRSLRNMGKISTARESRLQSRVRRWESEFADWPRCSDRFKFVGRSRNTLPINPSQIPICVSVIPAARAPLPGVSDKVTRGRDYASVGQHISLLVLVHLIGRGIKFPTLDR